MTLLLVARHADVHNPRDVIYGRLPRFRLSELGREQARRLSEYLAPEPLAAIYSSPQLRARQTALTIRQRHPDVPLHISSYLAEIVTGWQGTSNSVAGPDLEFLAERKRPVDETLEQLASRIRSFLRLVLHRHPEETVIAVSHGDPILVLRLLVSAQELTIPNMRIGGYPAKASVLRVDLTGLDHPNPITYVDTGSLTVSV